jgi:hypothetical protein
MSYSRYFGVISGMVGVTACRVSMVCRFLVMPTVVMLCSYFVVSGSVGMMLGTLKRVPFAAMHGPHLLYLPLMSGLGISR